ncbi:hypothetical protein PG989_000540 [Apiospora arundinis]
MEENNTLVDPVRTLVVDKSYSRLPEREKKKAQRNIAQHILSFFLGPPPTHSFDQYCTEAPSLQVGKDESPFSRHKAHLAIEKLALPAVLKLGLHLLLSVQTQNTRKMPTTMDSVYSIRSILVEMGKRHTDSEDEEESPQFFVLDCILAKLLLECIHPTRRRVAKIKDSPAAVAQVTSEVLYKLLLPPLAAASLEWLDDFEIEDCLPWGDTVCVDYPSGLSCSIHYDFPLIVAPDKFPESLQQERIRLALDLLRARTVRCQSARDLDGVPLQISRVDLALQQYGMDSDDARSLAASQGQAAAAWSPFNKKEALLRAEGRIVELEQIITRMMQASEEKEQDRDHEELSESEASSTDSD